MGTKSDFIAINETIIVRRDKIVYVKKNDEKFEVIFVFEHTPSLIIIVPHNDYKRYIAELEQCF